jgi:hypothetical protein
MGQDGTDGAKDVGSVFLGLKADLEPIPPEFIS